MQAITAKAVLSQFEKSPLYWVMSLGANPKLRLLKEPISFKYLMKICRFASEISTY